MKRSSRLLLTLIGMITALNFLGDANASRKARIFDAATSREKTNKRLLKINPISNIKSNDPTKENDEIEPFDEEESLIKITKAPESSSFVHGGYKFSIGDINGVKVITDVTYKNRQVTYNQKLHDQLYSTMDQTLKTIIDENTLDEKRR